MRTTIEIDDALMAQAMHAMGTRTKRETVEKALLAQVQIASQLSIRALWGKVDWQGDMAAWRRD